MPDLPRSAEAVIIGAGIMGCSIAYHLAERGFTDVVVLERDYIGRGATADAAGGIRLQFSTPANIELSRISMEYWENFEELFGAYINFRQQGYMLMLTKESSIPVFRHNLNVQQSMDVPARWVTPDEIKELNPAVKVDDVLGGTFCPRDGWADTSTSTLGFAQAARRLGVVIAEETTVTGIETSDGRVAAVQCGEDRIETGLIICCAGPQSRSIGAYAGIDIPILPYRRMSWVTDRFDEIPATVPFTVDFDQSLYFHPESGGFLFGMSNPDEPSSENKSMDESWTATAVEALVDRAPAFANASIRNGWAGFYEVTPDDNPMIGKMSDCEGFLIAAGFSGHGFMQGPAVGKVMAELIVDGAASSVDIAEFNPDRFKEGDLHREHNVI